MPLVLGNTATGFNPTVNVPLSGEARTALSVRDAPQKLLDTTFYLQDRVLELRARGLATSVGGVEVRCFPRQIAASTWTYARGTDEAGVASVPVLTQSAADLDECLIEIPGFESTGAPVDTADSAELTTVGIVVCGNNHSSLPAVMPELKLYEIAPGKAYAGSDGRWPTPSNLGSQVDTTATHAAYDQVHTIQIAGLTISTNLNARYYLRVKGESGAGAGAQRFHIGWVYAIYRTNGGNFP